MNTNSSNATQTLFRFASLRNPQLAEAKNNDNFIIRSKESKGYFDSLIQEWYAPPVKDTSKINYLIEKMNENSEIISIKKTEKALIQVLGYFYEAGKILAQKGIWDKLSDLEPLMLDIQAKVNISGSVESQLLDPSSERVKALWDSLIYQMLTQKDFYVKEIIIQSLQAINCFIKYQKLTTEPEKEKLELLRKTATAKVVIPDYLFIDSAKPDDENNIFTVNESRIAESYIYTNKSGQKDAVSPASQINYPAKNTRMELAIEAYKKTKLEQLQKELEKEQKNYKREYNKAYNIAFEKYQQEISTLPQDSKSTISADQTEEEISETSSDIQVPKVPEFIFEHNENMNVISQKLSVSSRNTLIQLLEQSGYSDTTEVSSSREMQKSMVSVSSDESGFSFNEIFEKIDENLSEIQDNIKNLSNIQREQYVKMGNALIPVNQTTEEAYAFSFMGKAASYSAGVQNWSFYLTLNLPDDSWNITSINYRIQTNEGSIQDGSYYGATRNKGQIFLADFFYNYFTAAETDYPINFEFDIIFSNGESAKVIIDQRIVSDLLYAGVFKLEESESGLENNVFIPNGFGIKRLGIADYMKVEQTLHAYVPGEVSNIENVMASELRHKSSSKLLRTEDTVTTATSTEVEHISDTTTTSRNEMQTEVSKILQQDKNIESHTSLSGGVGTKFEIGGSFANRTSKEDATRQAVAKSQEITTRAMDRVVSKVSEERVSKIIQEFTENNVHEFDNRSGSKHITGVYRWVDKKMKNQIFNYGKRMMLEFMIPQPAKLHDLATDSIIKNSPVYEKPIDPRKDAFVPMKGAGSASEQTIRYWADAFGVEVRDLPRKKLVHHVPNVFYEIKEDQRQRNQTLLLPDHYSAKTVTVYWGFEDGRMRVSDFMGGMIDLFNNGDGNYTVNNLDIVNNFEFKFQGIGVDSFNVSFDFSCELSDEYMLSWKQEHFTKIIDAYKKALQEWEDKVAALKEEEKEEKEKSDSYPFYRQIEEVVLKHNCIAYLLQSYSKLGTKLYDVTAGEMKSFKMRLGKNLDEYTALAKFMEQAFEWEIMSYNFYPYYWGNKDDWKDMYLSESMDSLFRSFLQAGMGRVIVTIKPGFEDAVNFYLATGKIWNGGEVPVIGDPLYVSIVDELKEPQGEKYGKAWITRIPTTLTILQAKTVGLEVEEALPRTIENPEQFEIPGDVVVQSDFQLKDNLKLEGSDKPSTLPKSIIKPI
ncbi:hypothetical protein CMT25_17455 [Elizabethkingia anophelis]|uniref:hypothetical protein n=1 Tax=Elizabethkingia anophelis TaxID=1117645 RepID=UPI001177A08D|nr:hypothetical protein [Elizabethkingia anophelis]MDV4131929.1 hypothetical protein [Elizabethkingia anophelis]MDV4132732.1 hypothetical protein [Elizabethkingia anophelis]